MSTQHEHTLRRQHTSHARAREQAPARVLALLLALLLALALACGASAESHAHAHAAHAHAHARQGHLIKDGPCPCQQHMRTRAPQHMCQQVSTNDTDTQHTTTNAEQQCVQAMQLSTKPA